MTETSHTTELAISCTGIIKEFGQGQTRIQVLKGVDFSAKYGEMTFIVGPSGCGKTTLISIIGGLLSLNAGSMQVLGRDLTKLRGGKLVTFRLHHIGFIFQQFNLLPTLTAVENATVTLLARGVRQSHANQLAGELLTKLGMEKHMHKYPNKLSGGQQQRVAIARALVHDPQLVICDEPTASLDAESGHNVLELLKDIALTPDRAVVIVTHDNRIFSFADRIAHMADGLVERIEDKIPKASERQGSP